MSKQRNRTIPGDTRGGTDGAGFTTFPEKKNQLLVSIMTNQWAM